MQTIHKHYAAISLLMVMSFISKGLFAKTADNPEASSNSVSINYPLTLDSLTLAQTIKLAAKFDPWVKGNEYSQREVESMAVSAGELPDPKMSLGLANIGADKFNFGQEPMTQLKVGISQMIPRGQTRALSREKLNTMAKQYPHQRQDRKGQLAVLVSQLWLNVYQTQESIRLIDKNRSLFEYLVDVAEASYSTASDRTRQQDLIRAQLELTRLDDRLTVLHQNKEKYSQQLNQYLTDYSNDSYSEFNRSYKVQEITIANELPHVRLLARSLTEKSSEIDNNRLYRIFSQHPAIIAIHQRVLAKQVGVKLARQKQKPSWGLNASYGYRAEGDNAMRRADLFSVGVTFDLPLFTKNRQDQDLKAAIASADAMETEESLLLRKMIASFKSTQALLNGLQQRQQIYSQQLLPQMNEQAEASLTAYTNDDGDFSEVVRARIAELNAQIDALKINVDIQKSKIELNYLFMTDANEISASVTENTHESP